MTPIVCPFHTLQSNYLEPRPVKHLIAVCCDVCGAQGPSAATDDLAIAFWNTRAGSEYQAEIDALKEELRQLKGGK